MNKIIICDLDGTLLETNGELAPDTIKKVHEFIDSGGMFLIATGRLDHDIVYIENKLGIRSSYRISQNGAVIKNKYHELVWKQEMELDSAKEIVTLLKEKNLRVEISDEYHRYFPSPRLPGTVAEFVDRSIIDPNVHHKIGIDLFPTLLLTFGSKKIFQYLIKQIAAEHGQKVDVLRTSPSSLEFLSKGVSKGAAIKRVVNDLKVTSNTLCTIGDSENDVSMFEVADYAYAVSTAPVNIQNEADEVYPTVVDCIDAFMKKS